MPIWVIDFKSTPRVYDEYLTQDSVYFKIWNLFYAVENGNWAEKAGILRLDKESGKLDNPVVVEVPNPDERWEAFIKLREYYGIMIEPYLSEKKMDRFYPCDGDKFATVTTILDLLTKIPGQWFANVTIDFLKNQIRSDTYYTQEQLEYFFKTAKTIHKQVSKKAMDIGTLVHDKIHAFLSGVSKDTIYKEIEDNPPLTTAFLTFEEWAKQVDPKPIALEKILLDKKHRIGGTVDFIGYLA